MVGVVEAEQNIIDFDLSTLPEISDEVLGASFEELSTIAATQPDNKLALEGLRLTVRLAVETGRVDMAYQMAMTLGAMACNHEHLQALATETGKLADAHNHDIGETPHVHGRDSEPKHDSKTCKDCSSGKPCCKKRQKIR
jgi:hypothetical protein